MRMLNDMEMSLKKKSSLFEYSLLLMSKRKLSFFISLCLFCCSSRPGRPPKRNSAHQIDDCLEDKRIKLSSSLLLRSFPDFANQSNDKNFIFIIQDFFLFLRF